jgi:hypothetical protein
VESPAGADADETLVFGEAFLDSEGEAASAARFLLLVLDRRSGNLARAQLDLVSIERALEATRLGTV